MYDWCTYWLQGVSNGHILLRGWPIQTKNKHIILVLPLKNSWWRSCSIVLMQQKRPLSCELEQRSLFEKKSILLEKLFKFALTPSANGWAKKIINQGRLFCPGFWWPLYPGWKQASLVRRSGGGRADGGVLWVEEDNQLSFWESAVVLPIERTCEI